MQLNAILVDNDSPNRRSSPRRSLKLSAGLVDHSGNPASAVIRDIGTAGFLLESETVELKTGEILQLELPVNGVAQVQVVWENAPFYGCKLEGKFSNSEMAAMLLKAAPSQAAIPEEPRAIIQQHRLTRNVRLEPELNFLIAFLLSSAIWGAALVVLIFY